MATTLDAQYKALDSQAADALERRRQAEAAGRLEAEQKGLTGAAARAYAKQTPAYKQANAERESLLNQRNAVEAQRNVQPAATAYGSTTQYTTFDENGDAASVVTRTNVSGQPQTVSQTAADPAPAADPVPQSWSTPEYSTPQTSTADQPIPYVSDEMYLDPLYEPAPTSPTVGKLPTSPYDINQDGTVSDSEYLYGDDELYEPVPTDDELASIQEDLDFAAADAEFANLQTDVEWTEDFYLDNAEDLDAIAAKYGVDPTSPQARALWEQEYGYDDDLSFSNPNTSAGYTQPAPKPPTPPRDLSQYRTLNKDDWRFRVRLSPFADYLYKNPRGAGILQPLAATDGVLFPYTPQITMSQTASYQSYNPTHSNFRGHFYTASQQGDIIVNANFTAQDVNEANYMLAMMHFFRSASKMFYGQDQKRGTPPPLMYISGMGDYGFTEHPVVVSSFQYTLPDNVDYIATSDPNTGYTPQGRMSAGSGYETLTSSWIRKGLSSLLSGSLPDLGNFFGGSPSISGVTRTTAGKTYVPTSLNIQLMFLPVNTREQVSNFYSLEDFATGSLLKKGYW